MSPALSASFLTQRTPASISRGAALTFFSVRVSDKPADEDHTYGHGKIENLSAFTEAGLMGVSCAWIIFEAMRRILGHGVKVRVSAWPIAVVIASICVDYWRSRKLLDVAVRTGSPALATDAATSLPTSGLLLAVLVGLFIAWIGDRIGNPSLHYADPIAAIVVSLLILRMTIRLGHEAVSVLTDEIPAETRRRLIREVESVHGVLAVEQRPRPPRRRRLLRRPHARPAAPLHLRTHR